MFVFLILFQSQIEDIFCSSNFYNPFFCISDIYKSIIIIFSVNLPLVFIYKFCKKEIQLQPRGEPRENSLREVLQGRAKSISENQIISSWDLFNSSVFLVQVSIIQNYLKIKKFLYGNFRGEWTNSDYIWCLCQTFFTNNSGHQSNGEYRQVMQSVFPQPVLLREAAKKVLS